MNYTNLTKTQRRCIDAFVELQPSLATSPSISRKTVEELWNTLFEARQNGGEKIGYPMWLVKGKKVARGVYEFPAPQLSASSKKAKSAPKVESQEEQEFLNDIAEAGLLEVA